MSLDDPSGKYSAAEIGDSPSFSSEATRKKVSVIVQGGVADFFRIYLRREGITQVTFKELGDNIYKVSAVGTTRKKLEKALLSLDNVQPYTPPKVA